MVPVWLCNTAMGALVFRHHTLIVLSQLPEASRVFSWFTAMSVISELCPLRVANSLPLLAFQILIRASSAPLHEIKLKSIRNLIARDWKLIVSAEYLLNSLICINILLQCTYIHVECKIRQANWLRTLISFTLIIYQVTFLNKSYIKQDLYL